MVKNGDVVKRRQVFARTGHGHPEVATPPRHCGVRINGDYVDPMLFLGSGSLVDIVHLADLGPQAQGWLDRQRTRFLWAADALRTAPDPGSSRRTLAPPPARPGAVAWSRCPPAGLRRSL